jgi:hypothetical protein
MKRLFVSLFVAAGPSGSAVAQEARQIALGPNVTLGGMRAAGRQSVAPRHLEGCRRPQLHADSTDGDDLAACAL